MVLWICGVVVMIGIHRTSEREPATGAQVERSWHVGTVDRSSWGAPDRRACQDIAWHNRPSFRRRYGPGRRHTLRRLVAARVQEVVDVASSKDLRRGGRLLAILLDRDRRSRRQSRTEGELLRRRTWRIMHRRWSVGVFVRRRHVVPRDGHEISDRR